MPTVNSVITEAFRRSTGNVPRTRDEMIEQPQRQDAGQEHAQDVLHPVEDPLALADRGGQGAERVVEQDEVRDAARRLAAAAHRDREVAALERQDVVDAVTGHRDVVAGVAERPDDALLHVGRDAPEDRGPLDGWRELDVVERVQLRPGDDARLVIEAGLARQRRDRVRVVARDDLGRPRRSSRNRCEGLGGVGRSTSLSTTSAERPASRPAASSHRPRRTGRPRTHGRRAAREGPARPAPRRAPRCSSRPARRSRGRAGRRSGRPSRRRPPARGRPCHRRAGRPRSTCGPTRTAPRRSPGGRRRSSWRRSPRSSCSARSSSRPSSRAPRGPVLVAIERDDRLELELVRREGARLVDAQHVDVAQRLDRVRLLDERAEA